MADVHGNELNHFLDETESLRQLQLLFLFFILIMSYFKLL